MQYNILKGVPVKGVRTYRFGSVEGAFSEDRAAEDPAEQLSEDREEKQEKQIKTERTSAESENIKLEREELERLREELSAEAQQLRDDLLKEAEEIRAQAAKEGYEEGYGQGNEKGRTQGYETGYEEGKKEALQEFEGLKEEARNTVKEARRHLEEAGGRSREIIASSEKALVELAMAVADKLLRGQLDVAPEKVVNIVREAINNLPDGDLVRVYVNGEDLAVCEKNRDKLEESFRRIRPGFKNIDFIPDGEITRGSCRVESESGAVEFLLDEEKEQLKEELMELARKEEQKMLEEEEAADE